MYSDIIGVVSLVVSFAAFIISMKTYLKTLSIREAESIIHMYEYDRDPLFINARRSVRNMPDNYTPETLDDEYMELSTDISICIITYQLIAVSLEKGLYPYDFLKNSATAHTMLCLYDKLKPYIEHRRNSNKTYAENWINLCEKLRAE